PSQGVGYMDSMKTDGSSAGEQTPKRSDRRHFFGQIGGVAATLAAAATRASSAQASGSLDTDVVLPAGVTDNRMIEAYRLRVEEATDDASVPPAKNVDNGDDALYPDKGGTYTKGLPHDS